MGTVNRCTDKSEICAPQSHVAALPSNGMAHEERLFSSTCFITWRRIAPERQVCMFYITTRKIIDFFYFYEFVNSIVL